MRALIVCRRDIDVTHPIRENEVTNNVVGNAIECVKEQFTAVDCCTRAISLWMGGILGQ